MNISGGALILNAADSSPVALAGSGASPENYVFMSAASLVVDSAELNDTNISMVTAGALLALSPVSTGAQTYYDGAKIYGFAQGDTIALLESSTSDAPASVSYNSATGVLTIYDASSNVLGTLNISGNYVGSGFQGSQSSTVVWSFATEQYTSEFNITLNATATPALTWASGASGDFSIASDWTGDAAPTSGETAYLGAGTLGIELSDSLPSNLTIDFGVLTADVSPTITPASEISVTDATLGKTVTLDDTAGGGWMDSEAPGNDNNTLVAGGLAIYGDVNFEGTLEIGSGDAVLVRIVPDSTTTTTAGTFDNSSGTIDIDGSANNKAAMAVEVGSPSGYAAGGYATYGTIDVSYGSLLAEASDVAPGGSAGSGATGDITLSNDSSLDVLNTVLSQTAVTFADGTDRLEIDASTGNNQWDFTGAINEFQVGDTIALEEVPRPRRRLR